MKKVLGSLAVLLLLLSPLCAQTRMTVLSDIHVMAPALVEQDGVAWQSALQSERKLLDYSQKILDTMVDRMLADRPDLLLITGDLTKDGERLSHEYVIAQLDRLRAAGIRVLVIPGNHDLGTRNALVFKGSETARAETVSRTQFAELYQNYGYGPGSRRDANSLSYSCEPVEGLVLIGIDSGADGHLSEATLSWVCQEASQAAQAGKRVVAMMHHALLPHFNGEEQLLPSAVVSNYAVVRNRLADAGVRVVLTGHIHVSDIAKDYNADLSRSIYDVSTGSAISYPCDYRLLTVSADRSSLSVTTGHVSSLPGVANLTEQARERLQNYLTAFAGKYLKNDVMASMAAGAMLIHAEGNENESEQAAELVNALSLGRMFLNGSIRSKLAARGLTWEKVERIVTSIMTDTTNYGIEGRADQTNDLTLTLGF